jgi:hypothetical protein
MPAFEPLTAGDALKRVPSISFQSDVIESNGAGFRGLDPGYTPRAQNFKLVAWVDVLAVLGLKR